MKSSRHHHKRNRWAHANTPDAKRRRRAKHDARREAIAALLPPACTGPQPLSLWQTVLVLDSDGSERHRIALYVPTAGRCDQHAAEIDGAQRLVTATEVGRLVAGMIRKRPSVTLIGEMRRAEWCEAARTLSADHAAQPQQTRPRLPRSP